MRREVASSSAVSDSDHVFDVDDGVSLANLIDIALDPDVGLDEDWDNRDTDADMKLDGCASL